MYFSYLAIEKRIQAACEAARQRKNTKVTPLAREFEVPVQRLRARLNGRQSRSSRPITTKRLDDSQEAALTQWIETLGVLHVPPTARMVEASANAMIQRAAATAGDTATLVNKMWVYEFVKNRLPDDLHWVTQKPAERARIQAEDISILQAWFDRMERFLRDTSPSNIYNFDETGFALGQGKPQKVISRNRQRTRILSGERGELLTGIECVAADGWVMEPYFVAQGEVHLERWYEGGTLSDESRIAVSSSGYSNDAISIVWLRFFQEHTRNRNRGQQRLLLFDGHGSHLTWEFLSLCESWNILPCVFPPHTTHIVQPLDGSPFRDLMQRFRNKNNMVAQWGGDAEDKSFFFREITGIRRQALNPRTIRKVFAERGIYPFQPASVIDRLNAERSPTPELDWPTGGTPPLQSSSIPSSPPESAAKARCTQEKISRMADREDMKPEIRRQLGRLSRTHVQMAEQIKLLTSTIDNQLPAMPATARKSRREVGKFGILTTKDANRKIAARKRQEDQASERKAKKQRTLGLEPMPKTAAEDNLRLDTPSREPQEPSHYYHPYFPH